VAWYWLLLVPTAACSVAALVATIGFAVQAADRNEPVMITTPVLARIAREALARTLLRTLGWFALGRAAPLYVPRPGETSHRARRLPPVVLVPGMTWNRASLWPLSIFLGRRGWRWVFPVDRQDRGGPLAVEAEALAVHVQRVLAESGAPAVDMVAFSTGGLVAAWLLRHHPGVPVRRLVTIGTAWNGTRMAVFSRGQAVDEIRYGSHVLDGLWPPPVPTVCIYSPDDLVVVPAQSATPVLAGPALADAVRIEQGGHVELLLSARVFRAVLTALDHPLPEPAAVKTEASLHAGATIVPEPERVPGPPRMSE
jgi:triacylglycerol esterase/lipase EstA (alpha/beta hydrolase family)